MDFLNVLYKKYTQNHISNILIIASLCLGYIFLAPSQGCPVNWDCNAYIKMVDSISYNSSVLPHHAMRILPSLIVSFLVKFLPINIETGFRLLSGTSYLVFSLSFYYVLNKMMSVNRPISKIYTLSITCICLASHHAMIQALVNVYQGTDALTYSIVLFMFYFTYYKKQFHWVFILTLIGIITRQNLFFMGVLCLLFGLVQHQKMMNLAYIGLAGLAYNWLVTYYHAQGALLMSITPESDFFSMNHLIYVIQDSGLLNLVIPILPLLLLVFKDLILFYVKNWFLLLFSAITVGQPFLSYHLTGNNFERIAMQGVWPLYLITGVLFYKKYFETTHHSLILSYLVLYAGLLLGMMKFPPVQAEPLRLILASSLMLFLFFTDLFHKIKLKNEKLTCS